MDSNGVDELNTVPKQNASTSRNTLIGNIFSKILKIGFQTVTFSKVFRILKWNT